MPAFRTNTLLLWLPWRWL